MSRKSPVNGGDRSPQRSGEREANESGHERLEGNPRDPHSPRIRSGRPEVGPCHRSGFGRILTWTGAVVIVILLAWKFFYQKQRPFAPLPAIPKEETIPPGIVVTETSPVVPPTSPDTAPGDRLLGGYGKPDQPPGNDVVAMARAISGFLVIEKQAAARPLSANEEWSAALRGLRPGTGRWFSDGPPVFDAGHRLVDRWGTPLIFHALGGRQWEIRSAGPDRIPWNEDDLVGKFSG